MTTRCENFSGPWAGQQVTMVTCSSSVGAMSRAFSACCSGEIPCSWTMSRSLTV